MQKEKSIGRNILIVVLILVTIASVCAGLFAWAKYQTTINGTATGETAKWSFKVSDGDTSTQEIEFPMTRTDNNTSVAEGKIAPGTFGELEIGIDATGTETALTYVIEGTTENLPTNLKFYSDEERTLELTVLDNKFSKGGYMKLNEIGERTETIYWEWPFETGITSSVIKENDILDTQDSSKTMNMKVSVTGKQVNGNPILADLVQVGDYVNYNASSNGTHTFTANDCTNILKSDEVNIGNITISDTISTDDVFNSGAKAQWRVLSVDRQTGIIELIAIDPTVQRVSLYGGKGFVNAVEVLNNIGSIYGHGKGAQKGRSIQEEDIEQYTVYDPYRFKNYGNEKTYSTGDFYIEERDKDGNVIKYDNKITTAGEGENTITMKQTYYYVAEDRFSKTINDLLYKNSTDSSINKPDYWVASQCVHLSSSCLFCMRIVKNASLNMHDLYRSTGEKIGPQYKVCPVVELQTNIQTTGQDENGVWQLNVN